MNEYISNFSRIFKGISQKEMWNLLVDELNYFEQNCKFMMETSKNVLLDTTILADCKDTISRIRKMTSPTSEIEDLQFYYRMLHYESLEVIHRYADVAKQVMKDYANISNQPSAYPMFDSKDFSVPPPAGAGIVTPEVVLREATKSIEMVEQCYKQGTHKDISISNLVVATEKLKIAIETGDDVMIALEQRAVQNELTNLLSDVLLKKIKLPPTALY